MVARLESNALTSEIITSAKNEYQLQLPYQFLTDFELCSSEARFFIGVETMELKADGEVVPRLETIFLNAIQRGVSVNLHIDNFALLYSYKNYRSKQTLVANKDQKVDPIDLLTSESFNRLQTSGVEVFFSNPPQGTQKIYPVIMGRNHVKMAIIDNTIAWLGSLNLLDFDFMRTNFMVKIQHPTIVSLLNVLFRSTEKNSQRDYKFTVEDDLVLFDAGKPGRSIVYDEATKMVQNAHSSDPIKLSTQFPPDGKLLEALVKKAYEGKPVVIVMSPRNHKFFSSLPYSLLYDSFLRRIDGVSNIQILHQPQSVHTKLLIVDDQVLFGSHSLSELFVLLGTRDIAIRSNNSSLKKQCDSFFDTFEGSKV